ncbi:peptide chain release factor N(5)-glutamine methyltransferase [Leadbettera azotonutricia]|uniref:Release factor glutamine methyltransferase n=1 Tax=Leadbettera azotonutricia (strain ATCC BAA-888 / DSM 13862 / ZAS-9) TaxID=545695 RepID=F5YDT3_LEAAZ|nr:peptide chain release factor N(5)-glutamine methyltransferase [Leadbettera azotonutricia]AEF80979.1 protein-(glutamine-N5) methyltransferase, release factor-specific [Leadbettera azotonutricia ZAS-9]
MTIQNSLTIETARLRAAHIDTPALDAGILLAEILHTDKAGLILHGPDSIPEGDNENFRSRINRRLAGEPVAYILGRKEFRGLDFTVSPDVLVPRPDTETLVEAALQELDSVQSGADSNSRISVLDLCTGSGAIAIALKNECPGLEAWASDISGAALSIARANCARLLHDNAVHFIQADLFQPFQNPSSPNAAFPKQFTLIVSNPPYIPSAEIGGLAKEVRMEPSLALDGGRDGLDLIRRIAREAGHYLKDNGILLMEADPRQMDAIRGILLDNGFREPRLYKDLAGLDRVISGTLNRESKDGTG